MLIQEKEGRILDGASRLFAANGLKRTTIEQIADEAGIGKGTIYLYFESKIEIMIAVIRREMDALATQVRQEMRKEDSAIGKLYKFLLVHYSYKAALHERLSMRPDNVLEVHALPEFHALKREFHLLQRQLVEMVLELGVERGEFKGCHVREMATAIIYTMEGCGHTWEFNGMTLKPEEQVRLYFNLVFKGLQNNPDITLSTSMKGAERVIAT